ncbi:MAG: acetate--CoA ligase family protein [Bacillota bacterium]|jgi:acyl-CoA synthetase (NDP forming)
MTLKAFFQPRGIVVAGSASPGKLGYVLLKGLKKGGFKAIYAVNPKGQGLEGIEGFCSAQKIEKPVDLVIVATPAAAVCDVLTDCGKAGIKAAIIISSGFSEVGNRKGEDAIRDVAKKYGIRYMGPNCAGMVNTSCDLCATLETIPSAGKVAFISQSGAMGGLFMSLAKEHNLGISKFVSYGNGGDLNELDFLSYLRDDPETDVIALYLENIKSGRQFSIEMYEVTRVKPVVVIKSGRTAAGKRATLSHTGSLAGMDAIYDAAFLTSGAVRVDNMEQMLDVCKCFSLLPPMRGDRLAVVTNSGGPGVMAADVADSMKLVLNEPTESCKSLLKGFLSPHASTQNPIDLTVEGSGEDYRRVLNYILPQNDAALAIYVGTPYLKALPLAKGLAAAAKKNEKPITSFFVVGPDLPEALAVLEEAQIPVMPSVERAVFAIGKMAEYYKYLDREANFPTSPKSVGKINWMRRSLEEFSFNNKNPLPEHLAMTLLRRHDINVPPFEFVKDAAGLVAASQKIAYPQVMKIVSPQIIHKSDCGGVILDIKNIEESKKALTRLQNLARQQAAEFTGAIIYPLLPKGQELFLGLSRDVNFGPIIAFGMGGIYIETIKDIIFRVAPVDIREAEEMIKSIHCYPILLGQRGQKGVDLKALAKTIVKFSQLPFFYPDLAEADLNPLFAYSDGVVAADIRILPQK